MNNPVSNKTLPICFQHNQPILYYSTPDRALFCSTCLEIKVGLITNQSKKKLDELSIKGNKQLDGFSEQLHQLFEQLITFKQNVITGIDKILQDVKDQIESINPLRVKLQNLILQNIRNQQDITKIESELNIIQNRNQKVQEEIRQQILQFQQKFNNDDYMLEKFKLNAKMIKIDEVTIPKKMAFQEVKWIENNYYNKFEYQLIKEFARKEDKLFWAFAFNSDNTILLVACENQIIVYEFNNGKIQKELQRLSNHTDWVTCLWFMKQSNGFVSGGDDRYIIIWGNDKSNQWVAQQILKDHKDGVFCLIMNNNEDLLISGSGSGDETIKFWRKQNDCWNCQQTISTKNEVYALSLNEEENKLISCGHESKILIFEIQKSDQQWVLAQTINVSQYGNRLCFTIGNQFVFQPKTEDYLEIYNYENQKQLFSKIAQVKVQQCEDCHFYFPCQFIKQLNILIVKHGNYLNILKVNQNGNCELMQTIQYEHDYSLFGRMTEDGKYFVTWDQGSKEIQVRQYTLKDY